MYTPQRKTVRFFSVMITALTAGLLLVSEAFALTPQEETRVDNLLIAVGKQEQLLFIRNGSEHNAAEAESHLRLKLGKTKKRLKTAEQFVDNVASKSSITGTPYQVKLPGQPPVDAQIYLSQLLSDTDNAVKAQ
ncbi:YfeK family protein [Morganella psychrotolerans]